VIGCIRYPRGDALDLGPRHQLVERHGAAEQLVERPFPTSTMRSMT